MLPRIRYLALGIGAALSLMLLAQDGPGPEGGGGGGATPGGSDFSTQYNDGGMLGGAGPGSSGQVLTSNGAGAAPSFQAAPGASLTSTQVGYGSGSNLLTGEAAFAYNATTNTLTADVLRGANGSNTAPTYGFTNDVDSGLYLASAGSMRFVANGNALMNLLDTAVQFPAPVTMQSTFATEGSAVFDPGAGADELTINSGSVVTGVKLTTVASATGSAGFNLPAGTAPSSPADGDVWTTTSGLFARINGSTVGPYGTAAVTTGSFTINWDDACSSTPTTTVNWTKVGNQVTMRMVGFASCTSDSTNFTDTGTPIPAALRPAVDIIVGPFPVLNNSVADQGGCFRIFNSGGGSAGKIAVMRTNSTSGFACDETAWTSSGNKRIAMGSATSAQLALTYLTN